MKTTCIFSLLLILGAVLALSAIAAPPTPPLPKYVKVNNATITKWVIVDPKGKGNYTTIGAALTAAPIAVSNTTGYYLIIIAKGIYNEYLTIASNQTYIMLYGAGIGQTIITGSKSINDVYFSATFAIEGKNFVAQRITFRNTAGEGKNIQAVAVRNEGDMSAFYSCSFEAYGATLYTFSGKQFYKNCDIYGTVEIVVGFAAAVFQQCNIYSRAPPPGQNSTTVAAHGRISADIPTGLVFQKCAVAPAPGLPSDVGPPKTFLGRPWGSFSRIVFIQSVLGSLIDPLGWTEWSGHHGLKNKVYYVEYKNSGPGAATAGRVTWHGYHAFTNPANVTPFTVENFIEGKKWLPSTGISTIYGLK